jgi:monoamine oxidase
MQGNFSPRFGGKAGKRVHLNMADDQSIPFIAFWFSFALVVVLLIVLSVALGLQNHGTVTGVQNEQNEDEMSINYEATSATVPKLLPNSTILLVGAGLTAGACLLHLPAPVSVVVSVREGSGGLGGRAQTMPSALSVVSTTTAPQDLGAWCVQPLLHPLAARMLAELRMSTVPVELVVPAETFVFDAATDSRLPYKQLPVVSDAEWMAPVRVVATADPLMWFAHTGLWPADVGDASVDVVLQWDTPTFGQVPAAFGWQDVAARALGTTPVLYNRAVAAVSWDRGKSMVSLTFTDGSREQASMVGFTIPPHQLAGLSGVAPLVADWCKSCFLQVASGVMFVTWNSTDVWWPAQGWFAGMIATSLPLGRVTVVGPNTLRAAMSGQADVKFWNDLFVGHGMTAALVEVRAQLQRVFPTFLMPEPVTAVFKPWSSATSLWKASLPVPRAEVVRTLRHPLGPSVPQVLWACADIALQWPSWVEGAVSEGQRLADAIVQVLDRRL